MLTVSWSEKVIERRRDVGEATVDEVREEDDGIGEKNEQNLTSLVP